MTISIILMYIHVYRVYCAIRDKADEQLHVPFVWNMFRERNMDDEWFKQHRDEGTRHISDWWKANTLPVPEEYKLPEDEPVKKKK